MVSKSSPSKIFSRAGSAQIVPAYFLDFAELKAKLLLGADNEDEMSRDEVLGTIGACLVNVSVEKASVLNQVDDASVIGWGSKFVWETDFNFLQRRRQKHFEGTGSTQPGRFYPPNYAPTKAPKNCPHMAYCRVAHDDCIQSFFITVSDGYENADDAPKAVRFTLWGDIQSDGNGELLGVHGLILDRVSHKMTAPASGAEDSLLNVGLQYANTIIKQLYAQQYDPVLIKPAGSSRRNNM